MQWRKEIFPALASLMFTLLYMALPTINHSGDAFGYSGEIRNIIEFNQLVWSPHHLFYNPFGAFTHEWIGRHFCGLLCWMQAINAFFAGISLFFLYKTALRLTGSNAAFTALLLCGSAFGFMRFATENETYIIPLALSMAGSYYLFVSENIPKKWPVVAGFSLLALAVLFHQMHIWWLLAACFAFRKNMTAVISGIAGCLIIIMVYVLAANENGIPWYKFPLSDANSGTVQLLPGMDNVKFTAINSIRTWVQVHGNIHYFLHHNTLLLIMACAALAVFILAMLPLKWLRQEKNAPRQNTTSVLLFRIALSLHFLWAFYSVGNAEFMAMIPFLLCLSFPALLQKFSKRLSAVSLGLLMWNLSTALIPNHMYLTEKLVDQWQFITKHTQDPDTTYFVARRKNLLENVDAAMGGSPALNMQVHNLVLLSAPSDRGPHTASEADIDLLIRNGKRVYTDCIDYPEPLSRSSMLGGDKNREYFSQYNLLQVDSFDDFYGRHRYYEVKMKTAAPVK